MDQVDVGLVGLGTVGTGVARILLNNADVIASRIGRRLRLAQIVDIDVSRAEKAGVPRDLVSPDLNTILNNPNIRVAVEVVGGVTVARDIIKKLLASGKSVVTANKALLATHGRDLFETARRYGQSIAFEASVGGGIPIIGALLHGLAANRTLSIAAIVNGTCNFILTQMAEAGLDYQQALRKAQQLGYAEADPTLDVDGTDSAHKLVILAGLGFGAEVPLTAIRRQGIQEITLGDIRYADELGKKIKLLATGKCDGQSLELEVSPRLVPKDHLLAQVNGAFNAISVVGDAVGHTMYYGQGAGQMPTGSAVVADIIDTVMGTAKITFDARRLWSGPPADLRLKTPEEIASRFYLRFTVQDRPGVLAGIAGVLGRHAISISSVIQHEALEPSEDGAVPLVIMTHKAIQAHLLAALEEIDRLPTVCAPSLCLRVED